MADDMPEWADSWTRGTCGCGGRACIVIDQTGRGNVACSVSGWSVERCPDAAAPVGGRSQDEQERPDA